MRRKDREITSEDQIRDILQQAKILHLALADKEYPYIVPMHYGFLYDGKQLIFYMHSAKEGYKLDLIRNNPKACTELECRIEQISGGEIPCKYGSTYASVIARGDLALVTDVEEKITGLNLLMKNQTGRSFAITEQMTSAVEVIRFTAVCFSAKGHLNP